MPSPPSFPSRPGSSNPTHSRSEGSLTLKTHPRRWTGENQPTDVDVCPLYNIPERLLLTRCDVGQVTPIDMLPDDLLLEIFDCFLDEEYETEEIEGWQTLVHVCLRWRSVVFGSPRRLDLCLLCSNKTPARDTLDVWPALPLVIECDNTAENVDNVIAVLERSDRVCGISLRRLRFDSSDLEKISAAMQVPFPELTNLQLWSNGETVLALPDSFLGGSAPCLEDLSLEGISFPGLPKLLLSATHLAYLRLDNIPHLGYISPEAIVTALSTLTRLETLWLHFKSPQSRPARRRPPPLTRSLLPTLTYFRFKGVSEYLEVVVTWIDAPRLSKLDIIFFNDIVFDMPQFTQFISRAPMLKPLENARVAFDGYAATVKLSSQTSGEGKKLEVTIPCEELDWQISSMEQVCTSCLPPLLTLENLYIYEDPHWREHWRGNIENAVWLELLHPFTSVKNLYLSSDIARRIVPALQDLVGGRATEVLPALQNILLEERQPSGPVQEGIQQVFSVRQATGHPIAVSYGEEVRFDESDSD
jgi:hypothetical protein